MVTEPNLERIDENLAESEESEILATPEEIEKEVKSAQKAEKDPSKVEKKHLAWIIAIVVIVFGAIALSNFDWNTLGGSKVDTTALDLKELHRLNYEGELSAEQGQLFNEFSFVAQDGLWWTITIVGDTPTYMGLHFSPLQLGDVEVIGRPDAESRGEEVYMAIDPEFTNKFYSLALVEFVNNLARGTPFVPVSACTTENEICEDRKIISCENNPDNLQVVELVYGGDTEVEFIGSCIRLSGEEMGIVQSADRLIYLLYNIMPLEG